MSLPSTPITAIEEFPSRAENADDPQTSHGWKPSLPNTQYGNLRRTAQQAAIITWGFQCSHLTTLGQFPLRGADGVSPSIGFPRFGTQDAARTQGRDGADGTMLRRFSVFLLSHSRCYQGSHGVAFSHGCLITPSAPPCGGMTRRPIGLVCWFAGWKYPAVEHRLRRGFGPGPRNLDIMDRRSG